MDYTADDIDESQAGEIIGRLRSQKELSNLSVAATLGYEAASAAQIDERNVTPRGYRLLMHKAKLPLNISENVIQAFGNMSQICAANVDTLKKVKGIGDKRANHIFEAIRILKET